MERIFDFVLLGGGPASVSAAETLRTESAKGSILMISGEDWGPYGHSSLSKQFLLGVQPKEKLRIHSEAYYRERAIDLMLAAARSPSIRQTGSCAPIARGTSISTNC